MKTELYDNIKKDKEREAVDFYRLIGVERSSDEFPVESNKFEKDTTKIYTITLSNSTTPMIRF